MTPELEAALGRLSDTKAFGTGEPTGEAGDDRRGHFWLITDHRVLLAVKIALVTGRPLLVEGESGSGKSALARAVSETLGWTYYETVVTSQTRLDQLTGWVDLVRRLHHAEMAGRDERAGPLPGLDAFVQPGVLWWALDPVSAAGAGAGPEPNRDPGIVARQPAGDGGAVVLLDEIDKAEPDVPNNLLVPLGSWELRIEGLTEPVKLERPLQPLVVISSNRERDMPPAFLRRCVRLRLGYPSRSALIEIAARHVQESDDELVELVASNILRGEAPQVSPAEFVDAVRAAAGLGLDRSSTAGLWEDVRSIVLDPEQERSRG
jgi:MoxR-like ATPase